MTYKFCQVTTCFNSSFKNPNLNWFCFPQSNPNRWTQDSTKIHREWYYRCGLDPDTPCRTSHRICSKHFSDSVIVNGKLKRGAVPTLSLPVSVDVTNPIISDVYEYDGMRNKVNRGSYDSCAVVCCYKRRPDSSVDWYYFPKNDILRAKWIELCGLQHAAFTGNRMICSMHFSSQELVLVGDNLNLKDGAIPSLYLPTFISSSSVELGDDGSKIIETEDNIPCSAPDITEDYEDVQCNVEKNIAEENSQSEN